MSKVTRMVAKRERDERRARSDMADKIRTAGKEAANRQTAKDWPRGFIGNAYLPRSQFTKRMVLTEITCAEEVLYLGEDGNLYTKFDHNGTVYLRVNLTDPRPGFDHQQYMQYMEKIIIELQKFS